MTQAEAAQVLGVSAVTVKRWLSRGLRLVTEQLADFRGDREVVPLLEGQEDDGGSLPEPRRGGGGVADRAEGVLLTFGDHDLGRLTRQSQSLPGGCEASESGYF